MDLMNTETLALFEELAAQDPGSSIFLHVARLFRAHGDAARAAAVLRRGLSTHPGHIEAGLLLADTLAELGESDGDMVHETGERLLRFPRFWQALSQTSAERGAVDLAVVAGLMALLAQGEKVQWGQILLHGVRESLAAVEVSASREPETDLDADEVTQFCLNASIRTKTMAKLFSMHGEHEQALAIYEELLAKAQSPEERNELQQLRDAERHQAGLEPDRQSQMFSLLDQLATRLETRTMARS
ncbi:hypothetical protein TDMWS_11140 [Thermodesulfomicrobium sp. WS]|nr:hypothetical protein TDMWS_11140 [Thermodesulfomicrobium sp. WS]